MRKVPHPEAEVLENMRLAFFDDLVAPVEEEPQLPEYVQLGLGEPASNTDEEAETNESSD